MFNCKQLDIFYIAELSNIMYTPYKTFVADLLKINTRTTKLVWQLLKVDMIKYELFIVSIAKYIYIKICNACH